MIDMQARKLRRVWFFMCVMMAGFGYVWYANMQENKILHKRIEMLQANAIDINQHIAAVATKPEKIVVKNDAWRVIQDNVKDTVVQVFAQIAETDLLQPYKTPHVYASCGSAFFINDQGDLITNAHVVNQATTVWIQIPSLGKRIIDVDVIGVSERDIALLRVRPEGLAAIKNVLGKVPYLTLGDSDAIRRADDVMAVGYPLGQQSLKSTTGVISGREQGMVQMSAAINPGNSGGPLLNTRGEVVGINTSGVTEAQNVGYIIPINDLKIVLNDLYKVKLLRKPFLGVLCNNATDTLTEFLGNPQPGGCYVMEVAKRSTLHKAGVQRGDMIYEINGHRLDIYGEMNVPWNEDKISLIDYVSRLSIGQDVNLVVYRNGERKDITVTMNQTELPAVRKVYPGYEEIQYEVIAGMVITPLTINHVQALASVAPGLAKYADLQQTQEPTLLITHIFPNSQLYRTRAITAGSTIKEINGQTIHTLDEARAAIKKTDKFLTLKVCDNVMRTSEHVFVALPFDQVVAQELALAKDYRFPVSKTMQDLIAARNARLAGQSGMRATA